MYHKFSESWLKHADFILLDVVSLHIAFVLSYRMRNLGGNPYTSALYKEIAIVLTLLSICVAFLSENHKNIVRRGYLKEFKMTVAQTGYVAACEIIYLFMTKQSEEFSRISFLYFIILYFFLIYMFRCLWKAFLRQHGSLIGEEKAILLIASFDAAEELALRMEERCIEPVKILGFGLVDNSGCPVKIGRYAVLAAGEQEILHYVRNNWVDEVMIKITGETEKSKGLIKCLGDMGIVVHQCMSVLDDIAANQMVEKIWGYTVVTSYIHVATSRQVLFKRIIDICGAIVGLILTGLLTIAVGPAIYLASPGPIFFSQTRIGRGGKKFKIYKFRSMYMDAEKRKAELMEKNKMNGYMFKVDADPRILGSGKDGTRKGIGWFIRKTSIDEFPQFWNVLKGEMSLVGTRPPTVDEWEKYEYHHRARMATKPGITGLWQVSGRNDITDFEEVVRLDMEYIKNWSLGEDIKILLRTVMVVMKGKGSA